MATSTRIRRARAGRRGNALVLSVLILMVLTAVGLVSIQQTATELNVAGNIVRSTQALIAGESGVLYGIALLGDAPQAYMNYLKQQREASDVHIEPRLVLGAYPTAVDTSGGHIPFVDPGSGDTVLARKRQGAAYQVVGQWGNEKKGMPGYDTDSDICHESFYFNARGGLPGKENETVEDTLSSSNTVVVRSRATAIAGPVKCTLR